MNVLILSPFKTGTTSLFATFKSNNVDVIKLHDIDETFHTDYSHIFLITRNQKDLYLSAFFQDIDNPEFEYYFGTQQEVLEADISDLISHFNRFDFSKYSHLDINHYLDLLKKYFKVNIPNLSEDEEFKIVYSNKKYFIFIRLECLDKCFDEVCYVSHLPAFDLETHNSALYKWYSNIYSEFKSKIDKKEGN